MGPIGAVTAVAAVLGSIGIGAIFAAVVTGLFARKKVSADATAILTDTARELLQPLRDRVHELTDEEKRLRRRVEDLESDLRWLRAERADQIRRDAAMQTHLKALNAWAETWVPVAKAAGVPVPDAPPPPDLLPLVDPTHMLSQFMPSPRASSDTRARSDQGPVETSEWNP